MGNKKKLFPSFAGTLYHMREGIVTEEDLADALFYFQASREYLELDAANNPDVSACFLLKTPPEADLETAVKVYNAIKKAVGNAEANGRAAIRREAYPPNSYIGLNGLLRDNSINTSSVEDLEKEGAPPYNHGTIKERYSGLVDVMLREIKEGK